MHQNSILFMILKIWLLCDISELSGNLLSTNAKWFSGREDSILDVIFTFIAFLLLLLLSFTVKYFFLFSSSNSEYRKETFFVIGKLNNVIAAKYHLPLFLNYFNSPFPSLSPLLLLIAICLFWVYASIFIIASKIFQVKLSKNQLIYFTLSFFIVIKRNILSKSLYTDLLTVLLTYCSKYLLVSVMTLASLTISCQPLITIQFAE